MTETPRISIDPTPQDAIFGWKVNCLLITKIEKELTYPAHAEAIEQIVLYLKKNGYLK